MTLTRSDRYIWETAEEYRNREMNAPLINLVPKAEAEEVINDSDVERMYRQFKAVRVSDEVREDVARVMREVEDKLMAGRKEAEEVINGRESKYGNFEDMATVAQGLKSVMVGSKNWDILTNGQREALEMLATKIARILNGDPSYLDSPLDVVGYAALLLEATKARNSE